jgi:thiosulfate/3-mercaptopyruvate sulfurtransferase
MPHTPAASRYRKKVKTSTVLLVTALVLGAADIALIQPPELVARLSAKPAIFQVGPNVLYRSKHIPGAVFAGPGAKPEGIALLKAAVEKLPRNREIVLYCGCCPWDKCPNVQPAIDSLKQLGFTNVKAMYIADNFKANWIDKGYPVE